MAYSGSVVGTDASTQNNTASVTVAWANVGTIAAGDIALLFWGHSNTVAFNAETTKPTGFTATLGSADGAQIFGLWTRTCTGSESGTITMQHSGSAARMSAAIIVVRGYASIDTQTQAADTGTDANHTAPAATPSVADVGVIIANGERQTTGSSSMTAPAGYTVATTASAVGTGGSFTGIAYEGSAGSITGTHTAGVAINPGTMVNNVSASDDCVFTVLLVPNASAFTGTATLSGSGTLTTPTKTPSFLQTCAFTGSGSLTFPTAKPGLVNATTALSGSGALTLLGAPKWVDTLNFTGSGTLTSAGSPSFAVTRAFTGSGTLSTSQGPMTVIGASASLSGAGTLTFVAVPKWAVTLGFTGSGTLGAVGIPVYVGSVSLSGSGTFTSSGIPKPINTMALSGSGTLSPVGLPKLIQILGLAGSGTLTTAGSPTPTGLLGLTGSGALGLAGKPAISGTLGLSGDGQITFTPVAGITGSVALTGDGVLSTLGQLVVRSDLDLEFSDPTGHALLYRGNYGYLLITTDASGNAVGYVLSDEDVEVHEPTGHTLKVVEREI